MQKNPSKTQKAAKPKFMLVVTEACEINFLFT